MTQIKLVNTEVRVVPHLLLYERNHILLLILFRFKY